MSRVVLILLLTLTSLAAEDYLHRWTLGAGNFNPVGKGEQSKTIGSSPMLTIDYGYHFTRNGQADMGVDLGFGDRGMKIPRFGYRAIFPFLQDRLNASLGAGAGYVFVKPPLGGYEHWLVYGQVGANYALDREKKFRPGLMIRWYRDPIGRPLMNWVTVGAEMTFGQ
ncbi:MAG: hypothetical protein SGI92_22715 [Bryobacteraceae bacterium]|nr:hypothetical protein [Bryobacteraceae bacterium]